MYILGSSLYGAKLAAAFGLPYAFASHFAPQLLIQALDTYRAEFQPYEQHPAPYVIAALNVIGADSAAEAEQIAAGNRREFIRGTIGKGHNLTDAQADQLLRQGAEQHFESLFTHTAIGTIADVSAYLHHLQQLTDADELITSHLAPDLDSRVRSVAVAAAAANLPATQSAASNT